MTLARQLPCVAARSVSKKGQPADATPLKPAGILLLRPEQFADSRGVFSEVYSRSKLLAQGIDVDFVQDNQSFSVSVGTVRGLHFQTQPFAQAKLVRVIRGCIWDVAVDIRKGSATFGQHVAVELSADNRLQLFIPVGFAHGFCTLEPRTEVIYKVSAPYAPRHDAGVLWNDPDLNIRWPIEAGQAVLSDKDIRLPRLYEMQTPFL